MTSSRLRPGRSHPDDRRRRAARGARRATARIFRNAPARASRSSPAAASTRRCWPRSPGPRRFGKCTSAAPRSGTAAGCQPRESSGCERSSTRAGNPPRRATRRDIVWGWLRLREWLRCRLRRLGNRPTTGGLSCLSGMVINRAFRSTGSGPCCGGRRSARWSQPVPRQKRAPRTRSRRRESIADS